VDCIHEGTVTLDGKSYDQLFIDPEECIDCRACVPACPWEAIYDADDVPDVFRDDIELNARAQHRADGYDVPVRQLVRRPRPEEVAENRERWGIDPIR
jgi:Fe-S-cluster-containing hydrogenase component 2